MHAFAAMAIVATIGSVVGLLRMEQQRRHDCWCGRGRGEIAAYGAAKAPRLLASLVRSGAHRVGVRRRRQFVFVYVLGPIAGALAAALAYDAAILHGGPSVRPVDRLS
ncbi:MAG: hypothetical protein ACRDLN_15915 [Solirubrobacteraceae bacterium]